METTFIDFGDVGLSELAERDEEDYEESMIYYDHHGGGCCGAGHLSNFTDVTEETLNYLDEKLAANIDPTGVKKYSHLYEVMLTDYQMKTWAKPLKERGFKFCARWLNSNSGNYCNLLVYVVGGEPMTNPSYEW